MNEAGAGAGLLRAVPGAVAPGQSAALLELVQAQPPAARPRRAGAAGRHDARGDGAATRSTRSASTWPACRPAARWPRSWATPIPTCIAAVGVHSGLAAGARTDLPSALTAMKRGGAGAATAAASGVPTIVFHGDADATVHPRNGEQVIAASVGHAAAVEVEQLQRRRRPRATRAACTAAADGRVRGRALDRARRAARLVGRQRRGLLHRRPRARTPAPRCCASSSSIRGRPRTEAAAQEPQ